MSSIRSQVIIFTALMMMVPVLIVGGGGILYYQDVIKHNIWDDNLAQAKAISALTVNYVDLGENYLNSLAARPQVISAMESDNLSYLNATTRYEANESLEFDSLFITDDSGNVLSYYSTSSGNTDNDQVGKNFYHHQFISQVLNTSGPYVSDASHNVSDGQATIYIGVPIRDVNNTTIGVLVGSLDLDNYTRIVVGTQVKNSQTFSWSIRAAMSLYTTIKAI